MTVASTPHASVRPRSTHSKTNLGDVRPFHASAPTTPVRDARVTGAVPEWLRGELVRTCPAIFRTHAWEARHWFDGLGMLYAFRVGATGVSYRSALLETEAARYADGQRGPVAEFDTRMRRPLWKRLFQPIPSVTDNTNVNVIDLGGERVALTESPHQVIVDPASLAAKGRVAYTDDLPERGIMSAHPQFDFERRRVVNTIVSFGASPWVGFYEHAPEARARKLVARIATPRLPYIHAFGLTPRHAILIAHPFDVSPLRLLWSDRGFIENFEWRPREGTRLVVCDRITGAVQTFVTDPMFVFHTAHAFERDGEIVLDLVAHAGPEIIGRLRTEAMLASSPSVTGKLVRVRMRPGRERAEVEPLADAAMEFPSVSYRRVEGRPEQFVWGASVAPEKGQSASTLYKIDTSGGAPRTYQEPGVVYGEPIFVGKPGGTGEDDGVILSVGSSLSEDRATLAVLDARTFDLLARAEVDLSIPLGFHGSFFRDAGA